MLQTLPGGIISTIKNAAKKLTGANRREFQAQVTLDHLDGNTRNAERQLGWGRETVAKGINELKSGVKCLENFKFRGNKKTEEKLSSLEDDIRSLVDPKSQADPKFQSPFAYTRITAKAVRSALIEQKGYQEEQLPSERTINTILNRLGYCLRRVQKTKPVKKIPETDEIFDNVDAANLESDQKDDSLRISIDTKAKLAVGEFSRGGVSRGTEATKGLDHDMNPEAKLVPFGILEVLEAALTIIFSSSRETSDFIVDGLQQWWNERKGKYPHINELVINLDNGPAVASNRTQFIKRMVEFADKNKLKIVLVYYPPYHSKYNPIERCWGVLENHWNGTLLPTIDAVLEWSGTMTWKGIEPIIHFTDEVYELGVRLTKKAMRQYEERLNRSKKLPKWHAVIEPGYG